MKTDVYNRIHRDYPAAITTIYYLSGALLFIGGLALRILAYDKKGFEWEALRDVGSFLAVSMAVAFAYERLIQSRERRLFLKDLDELLDQRLESKLSGLVIYPNRPPLEEKVRIMNQAKVDIVELGVSLRTFVGYFQTRAEADFKDHVSRLLRNGVDFRCIMIDPEWATKHGMAETADKAAKSLQALTELAYEFSKAGHKGQFQIYLYQHPPSFAAIVVDGDSLEGRFFFTPYLYRTQNAEAPALLIDKTYHPQLFAKLWDRSAKLQIGDAKRAVPKTPPAAIQPTV